MSDPITPLPLTVAVSDGATPGQMIRQARESMGLHIVALAAALKVPVRKLEALEANRWEELTDTTFTRALASSVARHLKMDAAPVLAGLPTASLAQLNTPTGLGRVSEGGPSVSLALAPPASFGRHTWLVVGLLFGAAALYFSPQLKALWAERPDAAVEAVLTTTPANGVSVEVEPVKSDAPATLPTSAAVSLDHAVATPPAKPDLTPAAVDAHQPVLATAHDRVLVLAASVDTWIEVTDSDKRVRIQRVLKQGEEVAFAEGLPFGVVVGNAAGARVSVRGQPLDLSALARNNVARFEVK